jgi:PRC-barrel domain
MNDAIRLGMSARASDGDAGVVDDILVTEEGVPRYVVVRNKGVFGSDVVLPVDQAAVEGNAVRLSLTKAQVHAGERYDEATHGARAGLFSVSASRYDRQDG